jgi:hypothetical protein
MEGTTRKQWNLVGGKVFPYKKAVWQHYYLNKGLDRQLEMLESMIF